MTHRNRKRRQGGPNRTNMDRARSEIRERAGAQHQSLARLEQLAGNLGPQLAYVAERLERGQQLLRQYPQIAGLVMPALLRTDRLRLDWMVAELERRARLEEVGRRLEALKPLVAAHPELSDGAEKIKVDLKRPETLERMADLVEQRARARGLLPPA